MPGRRPVRLGVPCSQADALGDSTDPFAALRADFDAHGDILHGSDGHVPILTIRHPDHIYELLVTRANEFGKRPHDLGPFLGNGLLTSDGELWRGQRKLIQPSFHRERIADFAAVIVEEVKHMLVRWEDGVAIDIANEMMTLSLVIVCRALFGHNLLEDGSISTAMRVFVGDVPRPGFAAYRQRQAMQTINAAIVQMIDERVAVPRPDANDMLARLAIGGQMSNEQLRDELITMLLAGHETTANALTWTFHLLALNPAHWTQTQDPAAMSNIAAESMRLYPPAYAICRVAKTTTEIAGRTIKRGEQVIASTYCCHRDERWFPEPERFKPDRFLPGSDGVRHSQAYLPFGLGARSCVGKNFGVLELCTIVPAVARRFRLESMPGDVAPDPAITLRPQGGLRMLVRSMRS